MCDDLDTCFCNESDRALTCPACGVEVDAREDLRKGGCINCLRCPECGETLAACEGLGGERLEAALVGRRVA